MQKLKLSIVNNFIEKKVTGKEIDFLIYISRFQSDAGKVTGVYYRDVCQVLNMSYQTFYDVKESLEEKGFISICRESEVDYDITILNNDFTDYDYNVKEEERERYISTRLAIFRSKEFFRMKANEKILVILLMKNTYKAPYKIRRKRFYGDYSELLGVTERVIRGYLKTIKDFFFVNSEKFCYIFIQKQKVKKDKEKIKSDDFQYNENVIAAACRRLKIKNYISNELTDVVELVKQYKEIASWSNLNSLNIIIGAMAKSLDYINAYKLKNDKIIRNLRPNLIHKLVREELFLA